MMYMDSALEKTLYCLLPLVVLGSTPFNSIILIGVFKLLTMRPRFATVQRERPHYFVGDK